MKKYLLVIVSALLLAACSPKEMKITVTNPIDIDRTAELVEIPLMEIEKQIALKKGETYVVKDKNAEMITFQVTYDGKMIFPSGLKAGEAATFTITTSGNKQFEPFATKVYGRFIQERKDDFAWENDRVAFRIYGEALIPIDGPSNGLDLWYKRTSELIIDKWYKNDLENHLSYHDDHGEGLDDYKVGRTLGAGAMAPYVNDNLWLNENFTTQEILEYGPLRLTFRLTYKDLTVDGSTFSESRTFSLDAGSQLTRVQQEYGTDVELPVVAGIVKRDPSDTILHKDNYLIYTENSPKSGTTFVGLLLPNGMEGVKTTDNHFFAVTNYQPEQPVTYYTGYGWTKFGFPNLVDFEKYMADFSVCQREPLVITYR